MITAKVTDSQISAQLLAAEVKSDAAGALITFSGDVRNHDKGREVSALKYEVHPSAQSVIEKLVNEIAAKYQISSLAVAHRYGQIPIGETAFAVAVSASHSADAFACCQEVVAKIKAELPIWKFQEFSDGTNEWVNSA